MQSEPENVSYWIQRADYTSTPDSGPILLAAAQSLLRAHDWKAELDYKRQLEVAEKDWCPPGIGFVTAIGLLLHILPSQDGTAQCFFWDEDNRRTWDRDGVSLAEQDHMLELLYRGDFSSLTRGWNEAEIEVDVRRRDEWLEQVKGSRARRGQPPELTEEERNLSEEDALALYRREAQREDEEQRREATIKGARLSRKWFLIISAGGTLLAALLYSGVLQDWLSERLTKDLWGYSIMAMAAGLVMGGLQHLELRALLLGTELARKQADFANAFCGTVMFLVVVVTIALMLTFFLSLLVPWLSNQLSPSLVNLLATINNERGFLAVMGVLLAIMGLTTVAAFVWRRASNPTETRLSSISVAGGVSVGSFAVLAFGPFILMFAVFGAAMSLMALGFTGAGAWLDINFTLATALMLPVTAILVPIAYLYGRWRAPSWEDKIFTLYLAAIRVVCIYVFGGIGAIFLGVTIAALKANGV